MNIFLLLSQAQTAVTTVAQNKPAPIQIEESYFDLIIKGGWIMLPLFLMLLLAIYLIIYKTISLSSIGENNQRLLPKVSEFILEDKIDKAIFVLSETKSVEASVMLTGLNNLEEGIDTVESQMELEARIQINKLESGLNWLAIISSVAPMLGFLGTIFGVIKIFYNIAQTNDLSINTISEGLYEKMICSASGLLVGMVAYIGYYLLNSKVDKIVLNIDYSSNNILKVVKKAIR